MRQPCLSHRRRVSLLYRHLRPTFFTCRPGHPFFRVPDELPDELLGPVNCAMGTVTTGLMRAGAHEGQYVVIQGAGGLGLNATAMAKDMGGRPGNRS